MFDEDDYYSDDDDTMYSHKHVASSKVLAHSSGSDCNNMTGDGESLFKMMKERGFELSDHEIKKMKDQRPINKSQTKTKAKPGFFDGGDKASIEELVKALNKAFNKADPQQANCVLSYLLQKKELSPKDHDKYAITKCNILFGQNTRAYQECLTKSQLFLEKPLNKLSAAKFSNLMAKCKSQLDEKLSGYIDYLRAKSLIEQHKQQTELEKGGESEANQPKGDFTENDTDATTREINHTELEYNIKMSKYKNNTNLVFPYFQEFRHRKVLQVVCGDYHTLFLVGKGISDEKSRGQLNTQWDTEVFGIGENTVGQITGLQTNTIYKQPIIISSLSGKGVQGIWACKESSLAYDERGNIYEWGIKSQRNNLIEVTYRVNQRIKRLEKGYKHYALMTESGKFYSWGVIQANGAVIYSESKPSMHDGQNIKQFSCGNHHTIAIDSAGSAYALGSNDYEQLCIGKMCKKFQKINNLMLDELRKVFCIQDATFFVTQDCEIMFCGRYSYNKETASKLRQAELADEFNNVVSISGSVGTYYLTNETGKLYKWDVDSMVKFKEDEQNRNIKQRYICGTRGSLYRVRSTINPRTCTIQRLTKNPKTYEQIDYRLTLCDEYGFFGLSDFAVPPKCQIFLSTYKVKEDELRNENRMFLESHNFCADADKILLNQIVESRLLEFKVVRDQDEPWHANLSISVESCGRYYFYVVLDEHILLEEELEIETSEREKQLQQNDKHERLLKEEERKRKAEIEKQRRAQEQLRKEIQEQEKRKETQRRAEEALKKHMREQEAEKEKIEQQRKARKELQTGGGFDLKKMKKKPSMQQVEAADTQFSEKAQKSERFDKTGESFLPDINARPNSRKKKKLLKPSEIITLRSDKTNLKTSLGEFSSTGFTSKTSGTLAKKQDGPSSVLLKRGTLVKRNISRKKN